MIMFSFHEGTLPFDCPAAGKPCETYYKQFGDLKCGKTPLIVLHGGPGGIHDAMIALADLQEQHGVPVVFYDQIGNGKSTHLREKRGDTTFWTADLFKAELRNLIKKLDLESSGYDILGCSWGGMLAGDFATDQPKGLRRLILSNANARFTEWRRSEIACIGALPQHLADAMFDADARTDFSNPLYREAKLAFFKKHFYRYGDFPAEFQTTMAAFGDDDTVNFTMQGPHSVTTGPLLQWDIVPRLHLIQAPTLIVNGEYDVADQGCNQPFFDNIPKVRWITMREASHLPFLELREEYIKLVAQFLGY
ncbi:hypothetical protein ANO11243_091560 [Dothideomycetidae sp. 11243]|nr:hypothetical protein ANO11243_091560 [fungal sp. No.11243]